VIRLNDAPVEGFEADVGRRSGASARASGGPQVGGPPPFGAFSSLAVIFRCLPCVTSRYLSLPPARISGSGRRIGIALELVLVLELELVLVLELVAGGAVTH
jgi:hypothetical protein